MTFTLAGPNEFARSEELRRLITEFVSKHGDIGLERVDPESLELGALLDLVQATNLFAPYRMIILRGLSGNKSLAEKLPEILASCSDEIDLIFYEPNLDMRTSYAKALQKQTDFKKFEELKEPRLIDWLATEASARDASLSRSDAGLLIGRLGMNQQLLSMELDKLISFSPSIRREVIEQLTEQSPQSTIFDLLAAAFGGDAARAVGLYMEQRSQKVEAQMILSMIAWQLHAVIVAKLGNKRSAETIAKESKLSPYIVRNASEIARRTPLKKLQQLLDDVIRLEITMKSKAIDVDDAAQTLLISIAA